MGIKLFGAGGIDQKSNNLLRADIDLVDSENMMINVNNEYVKRPGSTEDEDFTDDDYHDMIFIKSLGEYFHRKGSDYIRYKNGIRSVIPKTSIDLTTIQNSLLSSAEYLNTLIFTHTEGQTGTFKYDGAKIYMAGLPTPEFTKTDAGGDAQVGFMLSFYDFIDAQGNQIYGPATIIPTTQALQDIALTTPGYLGFYTGSIFVKNTGGIRSLSGTSLASRTMPYDSISSDMIVGRKVPFRFDGFSGNTSAVIFDQNGQRADQAVMLLEIESINTTTKEIVFTADSFNQLTMSYNVGATAKNIIGSLSLRFFYSTSETTGYSQNIQYNNVIVDTTKITETFIAVSGIPVSLEPRLLLSDFYDITTSKIRPPICKYLLTYGYQLICGNVLSFWNFKNTKVNYTNNDLVMYSDLSNGDLGENFSEINRQLIGNTYDGQITGLSRVKDSLLVLKDKMVFAMDGVILPGQYTLRKIETNEIGCTSFKSILPIESAVMFQGQDGIYITDGYSAEKATNNLDIFFKGINNLLTRSVMNNDMDQYLFWTDQGTVVFDYHYKKWFIWKGIDASAGITVDNERAIRFFSALKSTKFQTDLNDSGVAINGFIRSNWFTGGEPGLLKKATFLRLYSFNNAGQKVNLKYFLDWSESKFKGPFEITDMSDATVKTVKRNLDIIQNQSFSFEFRNNEVDEDLNISGYEINMSVIQERDKNVK